MCWLIDPVARSAEVFEPGADVVVVEVGGMLESPRLPGLQIMLAELFAVLDD